MTERNFMDLLRARWAEGKFVCVGLDSELDKIPIAAGGPLRGSVLQFNREIIDATKDLVCCYKPNVAFYEALGDLGFRILKRTIGYIHRTASGVPVILDAKRGDIGNTNEMYAKAAFDDLEADAITIHPYLGREANEPFLRRADKGVFVLCRTSNPGAGEFQDRVVIPTYENEKEWKLPSGPRGESEPTHMPLYEYVARAVVNDWNENGNCGLVTGATYPEELAEVRRIVGDDMPLLIPGIGKQGGDLKMAVQAGRNSKGEGFIINSSSGVIFASNGPDFADAARQETQKLHDLINQYR